MKKLIPSILLIVLFACSGNKNYDIESLIVHSEAQLEYALQNINK